MVHLFVLGIIYVAELDLVEEYLQGMGAVEEEFMCMVIPSFRLERTLYRWRDPGAR